MERQPSSVADPFWPPIHGEERVRLPALPEFVDLLRARGRTPDVSLLDRPARGFATLDELHGFVRRQLWLEAGGARDRRLGELIRAEAIERDALWYLDRPTLSIGVVRWRPSPT
jgi:hypothetical protein